MWITSSLSSYPHSIYTYPQLFHNLYTFAFFAFTTPATCYASCPLIHTAY